MPSKLPGIEMPPPDPEPLLSAATVPTVAPIDNILQELSQRDQKQMPSDEYEEPDEEIVPIDPQPSFEEEEVFNPQENNIVSEESVMNSETGEVPQKKGRRKYQRKGEMTEKQKAHLERIRAKATENRKKRKEEKDALQKEKNEALEEKREQKRLEQEQKKQAQEVERQSKEAERLASAMTANMYSANKILRMQ